MRTQQFVQPKGGGDIRDLNVNSENWAVVKACLVAGIYPNVAFFNNAHRELVTKKLSEVFRTQMICRKRIHVQDFDLLISP